MADTEERKLRELTLKELHDILKDHELWLATNHTEDIKGQQADLSFTNLKKAKLQKANLQGASLRGADLYGANFHEAHLKKAKLYGASLKEAWLHKADLQGANLQEANLVRANLARANLRGAWLHKADLQGANLQEAKLQHANLHGAYLEKADLRGANLQRTKLGEANLQKANLQRADLQKADLQEADLQEASLYRAYLQKANLQYVNLKEAGLQKANLQGANLQCANLQGVNLQGHNLQKANLQGANLQGANLQGHNLQGANLQEANLQGANLQGANLEKAELQGADFQDANLEDAVLRDCWIQDANLYRAHLFFSQMIDARTWIGEPRNRQMIVWSTKEGDEIPEPAVFLAFFKDYHPVAALVEKMTELPPGDFLVKTVRGPDGQDEYLVSIYADSPGQLAPKIDWMLNYLQHFEMENKLLRSNLTDVLTKLALTMERQEHTFNRLMESQNIWLRQMAAVFQGPEDEAFSRFLTVLKNASEKKATFSRDEATVLAVQVAEHLENRFARAKDDPGLLARFKDQGLDFAIQVTASTAAATMAGYYSPEGLATFSAAVLSTVIGNTIKEWWRKKEQKGLLPQPSYEGPRLLENESFDIDLPDQPSSLDPDT